MYNFFKSTSKSSDNILIQTGLSIEMGLLSRWLPNWWRHNTFLFEVESSPAKIKNFRSCSRSYVIALLPRSKTIQKPNNLVILNIDKICNQNCSRHRESWPTDSLNLSINASVRSMLCTGAKESCSRKGLSNWRRLKIGSYKKLEGISSPEINQRLLHSIWERTSTLITQVGCHII